MVAIGRRIAVLIGNASFVDPRMARLFAPRNDVEALKAVLEDPAIGGFEKPVRVLFDEALMTVRAAIAETCESVGPADLLVFYYTGHGVLTAHGDLFFALRDTTVNRPHVAGLEAAWLRDQLDKYCRAQSQVVILDCCHSGAYIPGRKDSAAPAVTPATFGGGHGRYVLTACTAQAFSWDSSVLKEGPEVPEGRTSVFTGLVVAGLKGAAAPDKETITADDLYDYIFRNRPPDAPAMAPQRFLDRGTGELVLARNAARLRPDLVAALNDANPYTRLGAVADLEAMLRDGDTLLATTARRTLAARFAIEEHVRVYKRIEAALAVAVESVEPGTAPPPQPPRPRATKTRQPREGNDSEAIETPPPAPAVATGTRTEAKPKDGIVIGVDPRRLPDLAVFKDVDAPWCPEMVVIPAGEFLMGSPPDELERGDWEGPQHRVTIPSRFAIGRYAVTVAEYRRFVETTGHRHEGGMYVWTGSEWKQDASKSWQDPGFAQTDRNPVVGVSWRDAVAYCEWLAKEAGQPYRLPSEAEWEYACRAGTTTPFSFGETINPEQANYDGNHTYAKGAKGVYRQKTVPVGSLPANRWRLYEMHGNVWEMVEDVWHDSYRGAPADGSAWTEGKGTNSYRNRVNRGGSWIDLPRRCRSADRNVDGPDDRYRILGFRVARTLS
jgi:formylglycine-generating enzyme required for sulfatase activity